MQLSNHLSSGQQTKSSRDERDSPITFVECAAAFGTVFLGGVRSRRRVSFRGTRCAGCQGLTPKSRCSWNTLLLMWKLAPRGESTTNSLAGYRSNATTIHTRTCTPAKQTGGRMSSRQCGGGRRDFLHFGGLHFPPQTATSTHVASDARTPGRFFFWRVAQFIVGID